MRTYAPWKDGESRCDSLIGLCLGLANFGCWPGISMGNSLGTCFCDFRCLKIRFSQMVQVALCRWLDPAVGGMSMMVVPPAHFSFLPEASRQHFCDVAGVCPNRLASQAQQSLLAKLKSAYRGSALGLPAQPAWCGSSEDFNLPCGKQALSHMLFMPSPQETRPLCHMAPWDTASCPEHLSWDVLGHLYSNFNWKTKIYNQTLPALSPFISLLSPPTMTFRRQSSNYFKLNQSQEMGRWSISKPTEEHSC